MKKLVALTAISGLLVATLLIGTSSAHVTKFDTTLTIGRSPSGEVDSGDRVLVFGKLKPRRCRDGQRVTVFQAVPGADTRLGSDRVDGDGEYSVRIRPTSSMRIYAKVARAVVVSNYQHTHTCKKDRSPTISIAVA